VKSRSALLLLRRLQPLHRPHRSERRALQIDSLLSRLLRFFRKRVDSKSTARKALAISLIVSFMSSFMVSIRLSPAMAVRGMIRDSHAGCFRQLGG
jgi:hypothetical protein